MAEFQFLRPLWLLALLPYAALLWWCVRRRGQLSVWHKLCDPALAPYVIEHRALPATRRSLAILALAGVIALSALAGPVWERLPVPVFRHDSALVVALDLSASMHATDVKPSRLERAKFAITDLLRTRRDGQTALIVFAAHSFVVTPLTADRATVSAHLATLDPALMPVQGSDPARAIELAADLLRQAGLPGGHVLLLTDEAASGTLERVVARARALGVRVSILGLGSAEGAPIPDADGGFIKSSGGEIVLARLDEAALARSAAATGGLYLSATAGDSEFARLTRYLEDDRAARTQAMDELTANRWREFGPWLVLPLLPLAAVAFRRGVLACALFALCAGGVAPAARAEWWLTPDQAGQRAFNAGEFAAAAERFADPQWRAAARYKAGDYAGAIADLADDDSARGHYNRGNALARMGQFQDALAAYSAALDSDPADADARYNKELIEKLLEQEREQQPDNAQQQAQQKRQGGDSQRSEQQFDSAGGGQSDQDAGAATNAGGGARSKEKQFQDSEDSAGQRQREDASPAARRDEKDSGDEASAETSVGAATNETEAERAQATEQWLRQIPDDPGGLLRRKFLGQYKELYGDEPPRGAAW